MKHVQIRIDDDLSDWVDTNFPHGFKQSFGEACFTKLKELSAAGMVKTTASVAEHIVAEVIVHDSGRK
jgi:hypothetical protein